MIDYRWTHLRQGFAIRYLFHNAGDKLPMHTHDTATAHSVSVFSGRICFEIDGVKREYGTGDIVEFDNSKPHEITALEPQTCIYSLFLHGMPDEYARLPASEHQGTIP